MPTSAIKSLAPVGAFHLFQVKSRVSIARAFWRMAVDRRALRGTAGLRFSRSLGCGDGQTFSPGDADLHHWALFTVWDSTESLAEFEQTHPVLKAWRSFATDQWRGELRPLRSRGTWGGRNPFADTFSEGHEARAAPENSLGVVAITRARIRAQHWRKFWAASPDVAAGLEDVDGLRYRIGIGEAPVGLQGTFSWWRDEAAIEAFAYRQRAHLAAMRNTRRNGWYAEEMFARFAVVAVHGRIGDRFGAEP